MRKASRILLAVAALAAVTGCKPLDDGMVLIFGRSMRSQRSFDPHENPRAAAANSVPFVSGAYPAGPNQVNIGEPEGVDVIPFTAADMAPVGTGNAKIQSLVNPIDPADAASRVRGQVMFERYCAVCHGVTGVGATAPIAGKHPTVGAYNLAGPTVQGYTDQYIYSMIRIGRGLMPEYGSRVTHFDRWKIVNYIRVLQSEFNAQQGGGD